VYKIDRPELDMKISDEVDEHVSETAINNINNYSDLIINNGTLEDLYEKIDKIWF